MQPSSLPKAFSKLLKTVVLCCSIAVIPMISFCQGFYVSGSNLKDANGNNFVIRGINNPHIWFDADAYNALTNLAAKKVNTIRIVWTTSGSASRLDQIIQRCIDLQMIPMVELHDVTGNNSASRLNDMAYYYTRSDVKAVLQKHARYILINIANEWSDGNKTEYDWKEQYKSPVSIMRNAGINTTLVLDAPGYGQNSNGPLWYGQELLNYDPRHNLLFSVHMYGSWNDANRIRTEIGNFKYNNLPLIIGEFGYNYNNGNNNLGCRVDHTVVMSACQQNGYGYIPWSYKGNDSQNAWLDLSSNWNSLLYWGNEVFYNTNGINNTSYKASIFTSSSGGGGGTVANGTYKITFRHSNLSLNVEGSSTADGGNVVQWGYNNGANEKWYIKSQGNSQYSILNVNSGRGLDVYNNSTADGADINQWYYSGGNNQKWRIESLGSGYYRIVNVNSGKCIDMPGSSTTAGTSISQYGCNGGNNQSFYLTQLGTYAGRPGLVQDNPVPEDTKLVIYPNPSSGAFNVNTSGTYTYTIYNAAGAAVEKGTGRGKAAVGTKLGSGAYVLKVESQKASKNFKLIKQ